MSWFFVPGSPAVRRVLAVGVLTVSLAVPSATTTEQAFAAPSAPPVPPASAPLLSNGQAPPAVAGPGPSVGVGAANRGAISARPAAPQQSARSWLAWLGIAALILLSLLLSVVSVTTLVWALHAWRSPEQLAATRFSPVRAGPRRRFSLLVPARHEEAVLGDTLDQLAAMGYADVEILAIVGHDDPGTTAVAMAAAGRHPGRVKVVVDHCEPKNKPKALNTALAACTGEVVGVFDAEDEVHPQLLNNVDGRFTDADADIVQGGVQLMNVHSSWWALRNCLEYYFWFRSRLHFHAGQRFIPLGGNTVFIRTELIRAAGGWDEQCLAEDCEIGVRLSTHGARVAVAYDSEVVTREETPGSLRSLVKQRTRWDQGFLQVLRKGVWRELPGRRQRLLARYTLASPFLQAFSGVMIPVSVFLMLAVSVPVWVVLISLTPLVPTVVTLAVEATGFAEFCRLYGLKGRVRDYVFLVLGSVPYQMVLAFAAVRAVVREVRGQRGWEKTEHAGAHRMAPANTVIDLREPQSAEVAA